MSMTSPILYINDIDTHEDVIIVNDKIRQGLESGELEMPVFGVIVKKEKEES